MSAVIEFCTGEPGDDAEVLHQIEDATRTFPMAAGDRVVLDGTRYTLIDADWVIEGDTLVKVRYYLDKATDAPGGLGE